MCVFVHKVSGLNRLTTSFLMVRVEDLSLFLISLQGKWASMDWNIVKTTKLLLILYSFCSPRHHHHHHHHPHRHRHCHCHRLRRRHHRHHAPHAHQYHHYFHVLHHWYNGSCLLVGWLVGWLVGLVVCVLVCLLAFMFVFLFDSLIAWLFGWLSLTLCLHHGFWN